MRFSSDMPPAGTGNNTLSMAGGLCKIRISRRRPFLYNQRLRRVYGNGVHGLAATSLDGPHRSPVPGVPGVLLHNFPRNGPDRRSLLCRNISAVYSQLNDAQQFPVSLFPGQHTCASLL